MPGKGGGYGIAFPLTLITIGIALLLHEFGYLRGNIFRYWPVLLIVWGVGMIWASRKG
ncbi:MAG: LiaI-LiaF-like domain-containing protein [Bacteroidota bacterium]